MSALVDFFQAKIDDVETLRAELRQLKQEKLEIQEDINAAFAQVDAQLAISEEAIREEADKELIRDLVMKLGRRS